MSAVAAEADVEFRVPAPRQEQPVVPAAGRVRTTRVRVPWRLVVCPATPDVSLSMYVKVAALAMRPERPWCEAKTCTLAGYVSVSTAHAERGMRGLSRTAPDGVVEMNTVRRTLPGGQGTSARRTVRALAPGEAYVWIPVAAAEDLTPRQLRAYAVIAYAEKMKIAPTMSELAGHLRHHSGKKAGQSLTAAAAGVVVDEVAAARWISVQRRAGAYGRHLMLAHSMAPEARPLVLEQAQEAAAEAAVTSVDNGSAAAPGVCVGAGSGVPVGAGSLAYKELPKTDSPEDEGAIWSPAVGEVQVGEAVENRAAAEFEAAETAAAGAGGRGLALRAGGKESPRLSTDGAAVPGARTGTNSGDYTGPGLQVPAQVYALLEPVHQLYQQANTFVQRRIAREVGHQLQAGTAPERLRHRLELRYARVMSEDIRDAGRWFLGVGLPRWGCGHQDCEAGTLWTTGNPCPVCEEVVADRAAARERARRLQQGLCPQHGTAPGRDGACVDCTLEDAIRYPAPMVVREPEGPPRGDCGGCGARVFLVGQAVADGLCRPCRDLVEHSGSATAAAMPEAAAVMCTGGDEEPCNRLALPTRTVCLRHRSQELVAGEVSG